jgi:Saxitoxin biosynthesis operon protein SxtJ
MPTLSTHENLSRHSDVQLGSNRSFGLVFAVVFTLVGLAPVRHGLPLHPWAVVLAAVFLALALIAPKLLRPLNLLWFKFGLLLHQVMSPVIMGLMFFVVVTPVGILMRATGKDPLRLRRNPEAPSPTPPSHWIMRDPPGPAPDSMKHQF